MNKKERERIRKLLDKADKEWHSPEYQEQLEMDRRQHIRDVEEAKKMRFTI